MTRNRYLALLWLLLSLVPYALPQGARQDRDALAAFQDALEQDGFYVTPGSAEPFNLAALWCDSYPGLETAWYSNYEPYIELLVPKSASNTEQVREFKLRPDEAIVLIGLTPPPIKYFGFYPFLATKVYPGRGRQPMHATLGDAVNNLTVKTTGPTPFNSPVALIFTPDKGTDARIRAALQIAGYPEAIINTVVFPPSMLNLGDDESADELRIALRNGPIWQRQADGEAYIANPPLTILRATPSARADLNPFAAPPLRVRGTGETEMDLMNKLVELRAGILAANPGLDATDIPSQPYWYEGYDYIQRGLDPSGDARDAFFLTAGWVPEYGSADPKYKITLDDGEFLMAYGANHVATHKATYMSLNVYASKEQLSIGSVIDDQLPGTAAPYLPHGDPAADVMYAYKVSRNCGKHELQCLQLSSPKGCTRLVLDSSTVLGLVFRLYVDPATKVGPAMSEILYDRIIKLAPRSSKPR